MLAVMADPFFPNVPLAPGVPPVNRSAFFPADEQTEPQLAGSGKETNADTSRQWGLFTQSGEPAAPADNIVAVEISLDARISDYPVAPNDNAADTPPVGFASYNKVLTPFEIRLIMTRGGSVEDRQDFLKAVQDAWQSTELFNVVTPEGVYMDVNVTAVRNQRAADRGNGLLSLEVTLRKVRQTAKLVFSSTEDPASADAVNDGAVQTSQDADAQQYEGAAG